MKASIEAINSVQRRVKVEVPPDLVNKAFQKAFADIQRKAHIQGFRPGKAPIQMIRKLYSKSVAGDVSYALVNEHIFTVLKENQVVPVAEPVIENLPTPALDQSFEFSALVDVMPEVKIKTHKGLAVTVEKYEVNPTDLERELSMLQRRHAKTKAVDAGTPASPDMVVTLSHSAKVDGEAFAGLTAEKISVELGRNELLPELETGITGMTVGSRKTISVTLPETYQDKELAGKPVDLDVEIHELQALILPAVDDEFAKDLGFGSRDELTNRIKSTLEKNATDMRRQRMEKALLDVLIKENPFEVPPSFVDAITDNMIQNFRFNNDTEMRKAMADEKMREQLRPGARRQAQEMLLLAQIAKDEKVDITEQEVEKHMDQMMGGAGEHSHEADHFEEHDHTNCGHDHSHDHQHKAPAKGDAKTQQMRNSMRRRVQEHLTLTGAMDKLIQNAVITDIAPAR